jgi:hypothetical protein
MDNEANNIFEKNAVSTHMQQISKVALQDRGLGRLGMGGSQFSAESHISLGQASRIPVESSKFID